MKFVREGPWSTATLTDRIAKVSLDGWANRLRHLIGWRRRIAATILGFLAALALPPFYALPFLVPAFAGLIWLIDSSRSRRAAFVTGWWFGLGHFVLGLYWIAEALLVDPEKFGW